MFKRLSFIAVAAAALIAVSCKKDSDLDPIVKAGLPMTPQQVVPVPATPSGASGNINATYDLNTKTFTYALSWAGLSSDSIRSIRLHGPAEAGYNGAALQTTTAPANGVNSPFPLKATGSWSQSVKVDDVVIKEADLLANRYYVQIYTKAYPAGELRGQINIQ